MNFFNNRSMFFWLIFVIVVFWIPLFVLVKCAHAQPAPLGYAIFALRNPEQMKPGSPKPLQYTQTLMSKLSSVNASVNARITPRSDKGDVWSLNPNAGDCEDFALTKRASLINAGLNAGALRMAVTRAKGQYHAVLIVRTTAGDFVLDNLKHDVRPRSEYTILTEATENPTVWRAK